MSYEEAAMVWEIPLSSPFYRPKRGSSKSPVKMAGEFLRQLAFPLLTYPKHTLWCSKLRFLEILALLILLFEPTF